MACTDYLLLLWQLNKRMIRWAGQAAYMSEMKNSYYVSVDKPQGKRQIVGCSGSIISGSSYQLLKKDGIIVIIIIIIILSL
jgi:hypothetical protein